MPVLPAADAALFIHLHITLLVYVNRRLTIVQGVDSEEAFRTSSLEDKVKLRDSLHAIPQLIDSFITENPARLLPDELAQVPAWK